MFKEAQERVAYFVFDRLNTLSGIVVNTVIGIISREERWLGKIWGDVAFRDARNNGKVPVRTRLAFHLMRPEEREAGLEGIQEGVRTHDSLQKLREIGLGGQGE